MGCARLAEVRMRCAPGSQILVDTGSLIYVAKDDACYIRCAVAQFAIAHLRPSSLLP